MGQRAKRPMTQTAKKQKKLLMLKVWFKITNIFVINVKLGDYKNRKSAAVSISGLISRTGSECDVTRWIKILNMGDFKVQNRASILINLTSK